MEKMTIPLPQGIPTPAVAPSLNDMLRMRVDAYNSKSGDMTDYNCSECKNRGYIAFLDNDEEKLRECDCMKIRRTLSRIKQSGLETQLKRCTFKSFEVQNEWQQRMKDAALDFMKSDAVGFFIGGQSGSGKTHICTALVGAFIKKGMSARYFVWREDSTILKTMVNDPEYIERMNEFKQADVLYIDDLFKQDDVSSADKKLAFELIDYRVRNCLKTIISTEMNDDELLKCDEGLAGRIMDMSRAYRMIIPKDRKKNYRLK